MACEKTEEFIAFEERWAKATELALAMCISSVQSTEDWFKYRQCVANQDALTSEYGCGELAREANSKYESIGFGVEICNTLQPGTPEYIRDLEMNAIKLGIEKCA